MNNLWTSRRCNSERMPNCAINAGGQSTVVMALSVPRCICWLFYFQNTYYVPIQKIKLCCWNLDLKWHSQCSYKVARNGVVTLRQGCSTEMVKGSQEWSSISGSLLSIYIIQFLHADCISLTPLRAHHPTLRKLLWRKLVTLMSACSGRNYHFWCINFVFWRVFAWDSAPGG